MLNKLFPKTIDNQFRGISIAKWILIVITAKTFLAAFIHMFAADGGAQSIASIALDQFSSGGTDTVITIFALWGLEQLVIGTISVIVLWRYQAMIPIMWLAFALEYTLRFVSPLFTPGVVSASTPPGAVMDHILFPLSIVMLVLSLREPKKEL